jgi:hypothetical protein
LLLPSNTTLQQQDQQDEGNNSVPSSTTQSPQQRQQPEQEWRWCQQKQVVVPSSSSSVLRKDETSNTKTNNTTTTFDITYQCQGPVYEQFTNTLRQIVTQHIQSGERPVTWGHRGYPLPTNQSWLLWGDTALRQVGKTILCQYATQVQHVQQYGDTYDAEMITKIQFQNGATLTMVINSYTPYMTDWVTALVQQLHLRKQGDNDNHKEDTSSSSSSLQLLQQTFQSGGIILGNFYPCVGGFASFRNHMTAIRDQQPKDNMDCTSSNRGPTIEAVASVFHRVVYVPLWEIPTMDDSPIPQIHNSTTTNNGITMINFRQFIDATQNECTAKSQYAINNACTNDTTKRGKRQNKCTGARGGHVDVVTWELIESFWATP